MKVLVCPLASPGFSFSAVAIALELVARGHAVTFVTEPWLAPLLRTHGLSSLSAETGGAGFETSAWHTPGAVSRQVQTLEQAVAFQPDLILTSALALGPLILGERHRLPVVVIGLLTELLPTHGTRRSEFQAAWQGARAALGLGPTDVERMYGDLYLSRGVPELGASRNPIGACEWEPPAPRRVTEWLAATRQQGHRVLYVQQARSFGAPGFWPMLAAALPADIRVAASTSRMDADQGGAPLGALIAPVVPQGAVLAHAVAVLCSGTTAVVTGAMSRGLPIVAIPAGSEQLDIAALIRGAGLGTVVPAREATPTRIREALDRAVNLDPAPRLATRQAFARIDGPHVAAAQIESLGHAADTRLR